MHTFPKEQITFMEKSIKKKEGRKRDSFPNEVWVKIKVLLKEGVNQYILPNLATIII